MHKKYMIKGSLILNNCLGSGMISALICVVSIVIDKRIRSLLVSVLLYHLGYF
ncbi:hypothetical protein PMEGAPL125_00020 [Priestia megaterium]